MSETGRIVPGSQRGDLVPVTWRITDRFANTLASGQGFEAQRAALAVLHKAGWAPRELEIHSSPNPLYKAK